MGLSDCELVFGVDGGGSGCRVAVSDPSGRVIGRAVGGPANFATDDIATLANVQAAIGDAAAACQITPQRVGASIAYIGLAGVLTASDRAIVADALPFRRSIVSDDRETSVVGALGDAYGMLIAVGTGSIVAARSARDVRCFGGWGLQLGDQASGAWLGREALRQTVLAQDGLIAPSDLTQALLASHKDDMAAMVSFAKDASPAVFAQLAPQIIGAAQSGDPIAVALMRRGAAYLHDCIGAVDFAADEIICLTGGVGPHYAPYLGAAVQARLQSPRGTALDGALHLARQEAGWVGAS